MEHSNENGRRPRGHRGATVALVAAAGTVLAAAGGVAARSELPAPTPKFEGVIERTADRSKPAYPPPVRPPKGAPNVLVVLLDDVGFGQTGTFGGDIPTPNLDALAANGLRYTRFHVTALCSPTRAALLTGRNHHRVGVGVITDLATGFPGYDSVLPKSAATIATVLRQNGYATAAFGKWHLVPQWEATPAGPFDRWPTGQGFEYFYGFLGGQTNQFAPALVENTAAVPPPRSADYHLSADLADHAIHWIRTTRALTPDRPYFAYLAPGATHTPHHAPRAWIDRFRGRFDAGWDAYREETLARQKALGIVPPDTVLTPRPPGLPAWDDLTPDERRLYARMMEVFAGYTAHVDHEVGRVLAEIRSGPDADNTLIVYVAGDNGASAEGSPAGRRNTMDGANGVTESTEENLAHIDELGGPRSAGHFPTGWAWAMSTPFPWMKSIASHLGGIRDGAVVSWPTRIADRGAVRTQYHHVNDVTPTILEAAGIPAPTSVDGAPQMPLDGVSMVYTFDAPDAPSRHRTQYYEMVGNRGIYHDGWFAGSRASTPWGPVDEAVDFDALPWELYDLEHDFSQAHDLAVARPDKLRELQALFVHEAEQNQVFPLDARRRARRASENRPSLTRGRASFTYPRDTAQIPPSAAPELQNRSFRVSAVVEVPPTGAEGMLFTIGGRFGGIALLVRESRPLFVYNYLDRDRTIIESTEPLPSGKATLAFELRYDGGGHGKGATGTLFVDDRKVAEDRIERTMPVRLSADEGMDVGLDSGTPVMDGYELPFRFTGGLERVTVDVE